MTSEEFFADEYKMNNPNRGRAIIINNKSFDKRLRVSELTSSDQDVIALSQLFKELGFTTDLYQNLSCQEMLQILCTGKLKSISLHLMIIL